VYNEEEVFTFDDVSDDDFLASTPAQAEEAINEALNEQYNDYGDEATPTDNSEYNDDSESVEEPYIDYKSEYEKITAPFKASGRTIQVRDSNEVISLMQKGVDYTKKQQALKPRLKELQILENQNMLGDNLGYAIDLFNGNTKALAKLIKDRNIDISELSPNMYGEEEDNSPDYTPTNYSISDAEMRLKDVELTLKDSPNFQRLFTTLTELDDDSKAKFRNNPDLLLRLNEHMDSGLYDQIQNELEHRRIVGDASVDGKNFYDAYTAVGNEILAYNANLAQQQYQQYQQQYEQNYAQQYQQQQLQQKRNSAKSTNSRSVGRTSNPMMYDPLTCSDEEFAQINLKQLFGE
jgi:hypothetical protein